ncbi:MAG: hypothetical protein ACFFG0_03565 [Candidatus Thorarchaeota archaeon]
MRLFYILLVVVFLAGCGEKEEKEPAISLNDLEDRIYKLEEKKYIGEIYYKDYSEWLPLYHWYKFTQQDIQEERKTEIKINDNWYNKKDIILYDKYKDKRIERDKKRIEKNIINE